MLKKLSFFVSIFMVLGLIVPAVAQEVDMEIGFTAVPPVLDGEVDEIWAGASVQSFVPLEDPANGSGTWQVLYDAENLYVIVDVTDDALHNDSAGSWQDDSVEIYFDGGNTKLNTPLSGDDHQYTFGWTTEEIQGTNIDGYTDGIEHAQVDTETGWRIEVKMPWMSIWGVTPQAGDLIGIDCYYNDDDDGGDSREGKMLSFSVVEGWNDASQWATAVLAAEAEPAPVPVTIFSEDFEGLPLGPSIDEGTDQGVAGENVWTDTPPEGWVVDESDIPGIGMDATDGVTEWAGWAFADKAWWVETAEDQDRSLFDLGSGIVAIADPDEWDDAERLPIPISADPYDTWLTTPDIKISSVQAGTLELKFDSSWRPEFDDNYHQTASITASFDDGDPVEVMLWESDEASPNYKPYATNETVVVKLDNPEGARKVVLTFGLFDAGNDWWWAIDNIEVRGVVPSMDPVNPGTNGLLACYPLDGTADDSSGNGIHGTIYNAETGGLGDGGSVWVDDPDRGTVISFNGTAAGAYVRAGEIPQMTLDNDFTWSFWAKHSDENTLDNDIILGNRMDENAVDFVPRQFIKFTPTKFEWHMNGNGDDNLDYDDIPADVWLHHAVVKTGDMLTYYRNGVEHSSGVFTQPLDFPQPLYFGGDNEGAEGENWSGLMSDVCIYERALSEAEVRYLADERAVPVDPGSDGLVAHYALENDATDSSGNGNDGTMMGDPTFVEGVIGMALEFDGDDYVDTGNAQDLANWTISAWVKSPAAPEALSPNGPVHREKNFQFNWNHTDATFRGAAALRVGGTWYAAKYEPLEADTWYHLTATYDGEDLKAYRDGTLITTNSAPSGIPDAETGTLKLGRHATSATQYFTGTVDEAIIYNRALSDGEIRYLAGERAPFVYDGDVLDESWDHDNNSDAWDGTGPGEGAPGGAALLSEDDVTFLRVQDTGDPRGDGFSDPSNRKVYLTHQIDYGLDSTRLEFQLRVATTPPLDNQAGGEAWPEGGIGYHVRDGGKGMVGIAEDGVGQISFSLAKAGEIEGLETDALVVNGLLGTEMSGDVDTGDAATPNSIAIDDATAWNNVLVDIAAGGAGTHILTISINGGEAVVVEVTAGDAMDGENNYVAVGSSGTGGITAFDVDYIIVSK